MSIESEIIALREAVEANTAALLGGKAASSDTDDSGKGGKGGRGRSTGKGGKGGKDENKITVEQVKAAAVKVKDELGTKVAKNLIKKAGQADALADIESENYAAFIEACEEALKADGDDNDEGGL